MKPNSSLNSEVPKIVALLIVSAILWCFIMNRWSAESWRTPIEYIENPANCDVVSLYAGIKVASQNHYMPLLSKTAPELGAPFHAQWDDFPSIEELLVFIPGMLAKFIGIFAAANFMVMMAHVLAAAAMYAACRALGVEWPWAFAIGLVFGFAQYAFAQGQHHITVAYYWHVPLCLLVCRWITMGEGLALRGRRFQFALAVAFVTGLHNVYYTFMFMQLAALGGLSQWMRKNWRAALPAVAVCVAAMAAFVLMNADTFVFHFLNGKNTGAVVRNYAWMELYALKVLDLFMPFPSHRLFAEFSQHYFSKEPLTGEIPPPAYAGIVAIAGLLWLAVTVLRRLVKNDRPAMPLEAVQIVWIVLFSTVGGLNNMLGVLGFELFRSTQRYCIFVTALALIFFARRISFLTKKEPASAILAACVLVLIALWDQTPPVTTDTDIQRIAAMVKSDKMFTEKIESRLQPGAMVFQLPIVDFPESPVPGVSGYDHFRPYLFSKNLRYQFGSIKGRPKADWAHGLSRLSLPEAVEKLERYGFAAVYVNRNGFQDKGAAALKSFKELGRTDIIESPLGDLYCVLLKPSASPELPPLLPAP